MATSPSLQPPPSSEPLSEKITLDKVSQEKNTSSQPLPSGSKRSISDPSTTRVQRNAIIKGFTAITIAGAFVASIQAQMMSPTLSVNPETKALRSINTFYLVGLVLDILSALLAFLTTRWFERLTEREIDLLEMEFSYRNLDADEKAALVTSRPMRPWKACDRQWFYYTWLGGSLFIPLALLILGIACMMVSICIYAWTQHPIVVASIVTSVSVAVLPFIVGDCFIGRKRDRREKLIIRLSELQGDW